MLVFLQNIGRYYKKLWVINVVPFIIVILFKIFVVEDYIQIELYLYGIAVLRTLIVLHNGKPVRIHF